MNTMKLEILRHNPETGQEPVWQGYEVPGEPVPAVLGALLYIQEQLDHTLAFRYACRNRCCGLCAVEIDGLPLMACRVALRDGMRISPLRNLRVIRDLVVDRGILLSRLRESGVYFEGNESQDESICEGLAGAKLRACTECMACLSTCTKFQWENPAFAGPLFFVRLAQLHQDPRDCGDRRRQAGKLGMELCSDCRGGCRCPNGIDVFGTIQNFYAVS